MDRLNAAKGIRISDLFGVPAPASLFTAANDNRQPVKTVTVRRVLDQSGVPVRVKVPVTEYRGVAIATRISEDGVLTSTISLVHADDALNYQVFSEEGNLTAVAEWQNWGRKLRLPLYVRAGDGELLPYSQQVGGVTLGTVTERRPTLAQANRRPRFLNRRQPGRTG